MLKGYFNSMDIKMHCLEKNEGKGRKYPSCRYPATLIDNQSGFQIIVLHHEIKNDEVKHQPYGPSGLVDEWSKTYKAALRDKSASLVSVRKAPSRDR